MSGQAPLLLVFGYVWPEPNSSAAGVHMLSLLRLFLAHGWKVIFLSPAEPTPQRFRLDSIGIEEVRIVLNDSSLDSQLKAWRPSAVLFDRYLLEEQFGWRVAQQCPDALRILDTEDLQFLRSARHEAFLAGLPLSQARLHNEIALREIAAIYRCDLSLIISHVEYDLLVQQFQLAPQLLCHCPFLVDKQVDSTTVPFAGRTEGMVHIGSFRHEPNWQAVKWLAAEIWPLVRQRLPHATIQIYGSYPTHKAQALHRPKLGFHIRGWAADALEVHRSARVSFSPLPFGAGLKGKFIDAMLTGTPIVTTAVGAEAMDGPDGFAGLIADSPQALADAAVELHENERLWQQLSDRGLATIAQTFATANHADRVWREILAALDQREARRAANFVGAMLAHHQHRSTKYFSKWIEAKNATAGPKLDE